MLVASRLAGMVETEEFRGSTLSVWASYEFVAVVFGAALHPARRPARSPARPRDANLRRRRVVLEGFKEDMGSDSWARLMY